jgi:hypothetical protein
MSAPGIVGTATDLLAKQAVTEVLSRYCRGIDRMDQVMALSVWHPDGTADYPPFYEGTGAGFVEWVWKAHAGFARHSHQVTNILIDIVDDEHAVSEAYYTAVLRPPAVDDRVTDLVLRGRYLDRWSRRGGVWAIDHRVAVSDILTTSESPAGLADDSASAARRGPDDPSHPFLGW